MTLKESLLQYTDTQKEIKELENKINKLEAESNIFSIVESSSLKPPFQKCNIKIEHIDYNKKKALNYYRDILQNRYDRLLEQQTRVEEFIDRIPTSRLRRIFAYKYIENFTWQKVAYIIGGKATSESVRKEHDRFLEEK